MKWMFRFSTLGVHKKWVFLSTWRKNSPSLYAADVTSITWQTGEKKEPVSSHNQTINHNKTQEGQWSLHTQIKRFKSSKSQQITPTDRKSSHPPVKKVSVFLFKCKLSNRFLTGTEALAKAISLIKFFYLLKQLNCLCYQVGSSSGILVHFG